MAQTEWEEEYEENEDPEQMMRTLNEEELYNGAYKRKQKVYERFEEFSGRIGTLEHVEKERPLHKEEKTESVYQPGATLGDETNTSTGTVSNTSPKQEDMQSPPPPPTEPNVPVSDAIPLVIVSGIGYAAWKLKRSLR